MLIISFNRVGLVRSVNMTFELRGKYYEFMSEGVEIFSKSCKTFRICVELIVGVGKRV